jgi:hypothetical protein
MGGGGSAATNGWIRLRVRRAALLGVVVWAPMTVAVSDCGSTSASAEATCHLNSDCMSPLICALGACRKECMTAADCISFGAGSSCISDSKGHAICQPAAELNTPCDNESMCTPPLACASDYRCRNICNVDGDCNVDGITGRVCATDAKGAHYCADPSAVTNGTITEPPAGASDAASVSEVSVPSAEAGPDAPNEGAAISGGTCDLANPNSCPGPGMGCLAVDGTGGTGTTACGPVGTQMQGAACTSDSDCAPGFGCDPTDMMCEQYCRADTCPYGVACSTCPAGHQSCATVGAPYNGINYGECH